MSLSSYLQIIAYTCSIAFGTYGQLVKTKQKPDSLCGVPINLDKSGKLLPRYYPGDMGLSYQVVCKITSDFVKKYQPIDKKSGKSMLYTTCCFQGPHMKKATNIIQGKSIGGQESANFDAEGWMHNPACVFAGLTQSLAIDMYTYTGDIGYVSVVGQMLDYQLSHGTTPTDFVWAQVPYASSNPYDTLYYGATKWENEGMRGDGLHGIEPDKIGELGHAYVKFYEITGQKKYLTAGLLCADALAKHVKKDVLPQYGPFISTQTKYSPWPFRLNARTGAVIDTYCAHVIEPIRLFDELLRIGQEISLDTGRVNQYTNTRNLAWEWLYSRNGPMKTFVWNAYFEDIPGDQYQANRNQVSPMETARYLLRNPAKVSQPDIDIQALIFYVKSAFGSEYIDAIKEQTWCYEPMASHSARYASVCAMYYERSHNEWFKEQAMRHFNYATYAVEPSGAAWVGHTWPGSWWSDGYGDYIKHFFDGVAAIPEWAPAGENHILRSTSVVTSISYGALAIELKTFDTVGKITARLKSKPKGVQVGNRLITNFTWQPLATGGILKFGYEGNRNMVIRMK